MRLLIPVLLVFLISCISNIQINDSDVLLISGDRLNATPDPEEPGYNQELEDPLDVDPGQGITIKAQSLEELAVQRCIRSCVSKKLHGLDLAAAPCLNERIVEDWSCDMVHSPRIPSDDDLTNRCRSYFDGATHHFIEVDTECELVTVR